MADCPKCGRQLTVAGSCIKCGTVQDRSKWYAIAEEQAEEERKQPAKAPVKRKAHVSAKRDDWYKAAGEEAPPVEDSEDRSAKAPGVVPTGEDLHEWAEVSRGRKDPPFLLVGGAIGILVVVSGVVWYGKRVTTPPPQATINLPKKSLTKDHSYGYRVMPPDGFKKQPTQMPEFARGAHGELTSFAAYKEPQSGVEAYYFAEMKKDTNLDTYANVQTADLGTLTPLTAVPEAMKDYPTKGYLIDAKTKKALVYIAYAKPDRYLSVWVWAPAENFASLQGKVEEAARAFSIFVPDGPHPDKMMVQGTPGDD